jgi:hypothetical protein
MAKGQERARASTKTATSAVKAKGTASLAAMAARLLEQGTAESLEFVASPARTRPTTRAAAAATKPVVFNCSNPNCIVGITSGTLNIVFVGTGGATMPTGSFPIFWRVQGTGAFTVTVQSGGTLSSPIASTAPDAGVRTLTVV